MNRIAGEFCAWLRELPGEDRTVNQVSDVTAASWSIIYCNYPSMYGCISTFGSITGKKTFFIFANIFVRK
jgi:hypothetical protein